MSTHKSFFLFLSVLLLAGCTLAVEEVKQEDISKIKTIAVFASIDDSLIGKRKRLFNSSLLFSTEVDWQSEDFVKELINKDLSGKGYRVTLAKGEHNIFEGAHLTDDNLAQYFTASLKAEYPADAYIVVVSAITSLGGEEFTYGMGGALGALLGEAASTKHYSYVLFSMGDETLGHTHCFHNYELIVVDAARSKILGHKYVNMNQQDDGVRLPEFIWADTYDAFTDEQKKAIKQACMGVFEKNLADILKRIGFN